jgi:hypothetical protein
MTRYWDFYSNKGVEGLGHLPELVQIAIRSVGRER